MARAHTVGTKAKRNPNPMRAPKLTLVPPATPPRIEAQLPRGLVLQGVGHPDCPELCLAVEAMEGVAHVLRGAIERAGRIGERIGSIEKSWTFRHDEGVWQWKVGVQVPQSITATSLELAKHLATGPKPYLEPMCLVPAAGYTIQ